MSFPKGQASAIEITSEMIKAGQAVYWDWEESDEPSTWVLIEQILKTVLPTGAGDIGISLDHE